MIVIAGQSIGTWPKKKAEHEARPSPTGRYESERPQPSPSCSQLGDEFLPIKSDNAAGAAWPICRGRMAVGSRLKKLFSYLILFVFTIVGDLTLNEIPEGGDTFGVPQFLGIGEKNGDFDRLDLFENLHQLRKIT